MTDDTTGGSLESIIEGVIGDNKQMQTFANTARHYLNMAKTGGWAIDEETGTYLRNAFAYALHRVGNIMTTTYVLKKPPKIGHDTYAQKVSQHMLAAVNSDEHSLLVVFSTLAEGLAKWQEAVDTAIKHYHAADEAVTKHFTPRED